MIRILFVCTGNTCRSPLAEALARREIRDRGWTTVDVASAGIAAWPGSPASEGSLRAAEANGLDLSGHAARLLDAELVGESDVILTMSPGHVERVVALGGDGRVDLLPRFVGEASGGVPDPFGGDASVYAETYRVLESLVVRALDRVSAVVDP